MFRVLFLASLVAGVALGTAGHRAEASPLPTLANPVAAKSLFEETGWRRRWRREQYAPIVTVPEGGDVETEVDVDVEPGGPAVIVVPPPRPASCGEYRYWNGVACVDARYNDPYLGPR
jgi:hypothetical protein